MCIHCYVLNICCFITNEHCKTLKFFVRPKCLSLPQESRTAGFGRPNGRQGITKCRAPDFTNKCRHPFWVQTAWAQFIVAERGFSSGTACWKFFCRLVEWSDFAPRLLWTVVMVPGPFCVCRVPSDGRASPTELF